MRAVGFLRHEIEAVIAARVSGKTDNQVRALVVKLHEARKNAVMTIQATDPLDTLYDNKLKAIPIIKSFQFFKFPLSTVKIQGIHARLRNNSFV